MQAATVQRVVERDARGNAEPPRTLEKVLPFLIFVSCFAYLCIFRRYCSMEPDEGIVLQGADRVLHGQLPYRDFFSFYTPGSFYFLSLWFRLFGESFAAARVSIAATGALCSVVTYLLARRVCRWETSLFVALLATATGTAFRFLVLHNWYSTLLSCLTVYAAVVFTENSRLLWGFTSAFCASLTILFEQSKGAGLCIGLIFGFLILRAADRAYVRLRKTLDIAIFALGFCGPLLAISGYFAAHHSAKAMLLSWLWPLQHYAQANHVHYGFQNWSDSTRQLIFHSGPVAARIVKLLAVSPDFVIPALPLIAVGVLIYATVQLVRRPEPGHFRYYVLVSASIAGLLVSVVVSRADILHFVYLAPLLYLVLAWILQAADFQSRLLGMLRPYLVLYVASAFGLLAMSFLMAAVGSRNRLETRRGIVFTGSDDTVIPYIQAHIAPQSTLLVYPYLPLYNFLTETRSPTRYDYFQPGMNTTDQGREIVSSLESQQTREALFEPWFAEKIASSWPGTPLSARSDPVANYIARNYRVCAILRSPENWRFQYMVRRQAACP